MDIPASLLYQKIDLTSGKYLAHVFYDTGLVSQLVSAGILNLMKDTLT